MSSGLAIEATGLTKRFGQRVAVDALNLAVPRGTVYGFLGPNGSGKTTTIRMLVGLLRPTAGSASLLGHDIRRDLIAGLRETGAQVESPAFVSNLSGRRNLEYLGALTLGRVPAALVDQALARVRLTGRDRDRVRTYSQGMKARLGLAQALLCQPRLLILDEPTNGLDPQGMHEVRELIRHLAAEDGMTVFISSHLLAEVQQLCDRVAILRRGQAVAEGPVAELLSSAGRLRIAVDEPGGVDAAALVAEVDGVQIVAREDGYLRLAAPPEQAAEINRRLVSAGVAVGELVIERQSLEDFYLDVTGREAQL